MIGKVITGRTAAALALGAFGSIALFFTCSEANAQANQWTWMGRSAVERQPGVYGSLGVFDPGNIPGAGVPAAGSVSTFSGAFGWTDRNSNLWLFGAGSFSPTSFGYGYPDSGVPNDLWEFDASTNEWAWMGGSSTISGCTLFGGCGIAGVYGTLGTPAPGNMPGSRWGAATWTDKDGNLWMFGGYGYGADVVEPGPWGRGLPGELGDLWKLDLSTPAPGNIPGSRYYASTWTDTDGNLWMFGGFGHDYSFQDGELNDLWEYSPSSGQWTWMGGSTTLGACVGTNCGQRGSYGVLGTPAASNAPGGRSQANAWTDGLGNFWLFGGEGYDAEGEIGGLNDLWEYNPFTNKWVWTSCRALPHRGPRRAQGQVCRLPVRGAYLLQVMPYGESFVVGSATRK